MNNAKERVFSILFAVSAIICLSSLLLIMGFIFYKGTPAIGEIGFTNFIFGLEWQPRGDIYGILPMIVSSILATGGAILVGAPVGVLTAVFIVYLAPKKLGKVLRVATDVLASIPSIVFGFFGLMIIVPMIDVLAGGSGGNSLLAVIIILSIMILPTVISITETALREVEGSYKEASLALGATEEVTIYKVLIPAAKSGVMAGVVLGVGRALGEAMAVILVSGNAPKMPDSIFSPVRTLPANSALEMSYATGLHQEALFATGVVLFVFIFLLNLVFYFLKLKGGAES